MTVPWTRVEPRNSTTQIDSFSSGEPIIDNWFHQNSTQEHVNNRVITHVCVDNVGQVLGFFSHTSVVCRFDEESKSLRKTYCSRDEFNAPAILLAKMGLATGLQGQKHGKRLCLQALDKISQVAATAGVRLLVVDAPNNALVPFYESVGFRSLDAQPTRLVMKTSNAAKLSSKAKNDNEII